MVLEIKTAIADNDIASCWEAMFLLRPMLIEGDFVEQIKAMQQEGYVLLCISENGKVVSLAGYRIFTMLYCGKMLYVDDLSTLEIGRGKGYASALLNYIYKIAKQEGCKGSRRKVVGKFKNIDICHSILYTNARFLYRLT